jgi:hypothetical protein
LGSGKRRSPKLTRSFVRGSARAPCHSPLVVTPGEGPSTKDEARSQEQSAEHREDLGFEAAKCELLSATAMALDALGVNPLANATDAVGSDAVAVTVEVTVTVTVAVAVAERTRVTHVRALRDRLIDVHVGRVLVSLPRISSPPPPPRIEFDCSTSPTLTLALLLADCDPPWEANAGTAPISASANAAIVRSANFGRMLAPLS